MQLVERHVINKKHIHYQEIDKLCYLSKNLYNAANYLVRQEFINNKNYFNYNAVHKILQNQADYKALPAKVSQQVLMMLDKNWKSFKEALKAYQQDSSKFLGRPKLPKYKDKAKGRNILIYTSQAIGKRVLNKEGVINPSQTSIRIKTSVKYEDLSQVRIVPKLNHYIVEVIYNVVINNEVKLDKNRIAGIDLGLSNLATITANIEGFQPFIVNGRPLKSINQYFNKVKSKLQSIVKKGTSYKIQKICTKRNSKVDDYLHKASRFVMNHLVINNIGTLVIGKNDAWKQALNIGKRNNQNFTQIPHDRLIHQLKYKAELLGIDVRITEESYTSKASFLDLDIIPTYKKGIQHTFSGKRIQRGLYKSKSGKLINADVNGSYNIIRKAISNAFSNEIEGFVVHPARLNLQTS